MTIRLLAAYGIYPCNAIVTLDSPTEAGLIAAKQALADTTGGTPYVAPVLPEAIDETKSGSAGTDSNGNVLTPALSSRNLVTGEVRLLGPGGEEIQLGATSGQKVVIFGDSLSGYNNVAVGVSTISRSGNVVTVVTSSAHQMRNGQRASITGMADLTYEELNTPITYISSTSFSYVNVGADGSTSGAGVLCQNQFFQAGDFVWANALLNGRMRFLANLGVGGDTTTEILARIDDVFDLSPHIVWMQSGTNDVIQDVAFSTIIANLEEMIARIASRNILCVLKTITPFGGAGAYYTAARNAVLQNVNQWIRRVASKYKGVVIVDAYKAIINPTDANGYGTSGLYQSADTVHYNAKGALAIARLAYTALVNVVPFIDNRALSITDNYGFNTANRDLHDRAPWTNSGGTVNAPATGTAPTGWIVDSSAGFSVAPAISMVSRSDGLGYDITAVMTAGAASNSCTIRTDSTAQNARLPSFVGKKYRWAAEVTVTNASGANIRYIQTVSTASIGGPSGVIVSGIAGATTASQIAIDSDGTFLFVTPEFEIPSGAVTNCSFQFKIEFDAAGTAVTVKLGSVRMMPMDEI